jgi:alpha-mannosidase
MFSATPGLYPQLIQQSGLKYFFTIKIGWSQYNRLPYDTFWWQGLTGRGCSPLQHHARPKRVCREHHNAEATPSQVIGTWTNFQQKEIQQNLLMTFGYGDGGGGPTAEMLENLREMSAFPATPRIRQAQVGDFFRNLESTSGERLPVWNSELYLELHRGTFTTQGRTKRANRKSEFLLHDAEFLATYASPIDPGYTYPGRRYGRRGSRFVQPIPRHHPRQQHLPGLCRIAAAVRRDPPNG